MKITIDHRDKFGVLLNNLGLFGKGVEVGLAYCGFSRIILSRWQNGILYGVDRFEKQDPSVYKEKTDNVDYQSYCDECRKLHAQLPLRFNLIVGDSVETASQFDDGSLDFVFIDANHDYQPVLNDMNAWYPKVKSGGVFSGHDYYDDTTYPHYSLVKSAVDNWMKNMDYHFHVLKCSTWITIKR